MPDTVNCATCGASIATTARFCPMCGSEVDQAQAGPRGTTHAPLEDAGAPGAGEIVSATSPPDAAPAGPGHTGIQGGADFGREVRGWSPADHEPQAAPPAPSHRPPAGLPGPTGGSAHHPGVGSGAQFGREVRSWEPTGRSEAPDATAPAPPGPVPGAAAGLPQVGAPSNVEAGGIRPDGRPTVRIAEGTAPVPETAEVVAAAAEAPPRVRVSPAQPGRPEAPSAATPTPGAPVPPIGVPVPPIGTPGDPVGAPAPSVGRAAPTDDRPPSGDGAPSREDTYGGTPPGDPVATAKAVIPDADSAKGFLASLFDFSFRSFVFPQIVQLVYLIGVVLISIGAVVTFLVMARNGATGFIAGLVVALVGGFLGVVFLRITMEIYLVLFSIRDHVSAIDRRQR